MVITLYFNKTFKTVQVLKKVKGKGGISKEWNNVLIKNGNNFERID